MDSLLTRRPRARLGWLAFAVTGWACLCLGGARADADVSSAIAMSCSFDPGVAEQILASYPDADVDGDGVLSKDEACAHQLRMKRKLIDGVVDADLVSRMDPSADGDGDGVLSEGEIELFKSQVEVSLPADRSRVVLSYTGAREYALDRGDVRVDTAEVATQVCATSKCMTETVAVKAAPAAPTESTVLIDVAFSPAQ